MPPKTADAATTPLQRARLEMGWKQSRAIAELISAAQHRGISIATRASLKTMLSRWENEAGPHDPMYQELFCIIYRRDAEELGFEADRKTNASTGPIAPSLDPEAVDYFQSVLYQHIRADNLMGPHHLVEVVRSQAQLLDNVLPDAQNGIRTQLLYLAFRYNELAGWLYQDAGDPDNAMVYSDRAMDYALAADDNIDMAYVLMRKSNIACDLGVTGRATALSEAGLRNATKLPHRIQALILGQQARAYALQGNADASARSIDAAMREVSHPMVDGDDIARYCTPAYVSMQAAECWTILRQPNHAIPVFEQALAIWPAGQRRDQGLCQVRLAIAHASRGDSTEACRVGAQAITTVRSATSARALKDLRQLRQHLVPWRRDAEVLALNNEIKSLTQRI